MDDIDRVVALAKKSGRLFVSPDIYQLLKPHFDSESGIGGVVVEVSSRLKKGSVLAFDPSLAPASFTDALLAENN